MDMHLSEPTKFDIVSARLTIDTGAVADNWWTLARLAGAAETSAVLKADAYGLGSGPVARALDQAGCRTFFVATAAEGVELRRAVGDVRIFVLAGLWAGCEREIFTHGLIPVVASVEQLAFLRSLGSDHPYALYIDTGMNRLGLTVAEAVAARSNDGQPAMVMSHLACADEDHSLNRRQLESFQEVVRQFEGIESSFANSGGIFLGQDYHFDLTRPGIALYGGEPFSSTINSMKPVVAVEARILQIRQVPAGQSVSYGATQTLARDSRIAVVGAGYADGWHRSLSGTGVALRQNGSTGALGMLAGHKIPVVGRVTMDVTMFDITDIPESDVRTGDYVSLFGAGITLEETARSAGTIGYELLTSLGRRYFRRYV